MADYLNSTVFPHISYKSILDQIQDGVYITNTSNEIVYWNAGAEKLLGYSREDVLGKKCYEEKRLCSRNKEGLFCGDSSCPIIQAIRSGFSGTYPHLLFMKRKDNSEIPVSINIGPIHDSEGKVAGGVCVFRDMREEYHQRLLAGEIQRHMNTSGTFTRNGLVVHALYQPIDEVGGDFIETFFLDKHNFFVSVADATGHGISAALFTMIYKTLLHSSLEEYREPGVMLEWINTRFDETSTIEGYYLTANIARIDPETGSGLLACAGHPPALIFSRREDGEGFRLKQILDTHSMLIGADEATRYIDIEFQLKADDILLMGTDGLYEAETVKGNFFGIQGISRFFETYKGHNPAEDLYEQLQQSSKYIKLPDDVGIIIIGRESP